ncbi:hypothetical protein Y695_03062 [Hydrogenophaga sp. T4]|nr:hypothetical protein Y695_03062 [Hydrogenophaga sp. T4]
MHRLLLGIQNRQRMGRGLCTSAHAAAHDSSTPSTYSMRTSTIATTISGEARITPGRPNSRPKMTAA